MSAYVDPLRPCIPNARWKYKEVSHLVADSVVELHKFAKLLGLRKGWFQDKAFTPHYDITRERRSKAIEAGALAVSTKELVWRIRKSRREYCQGTGRLT